MIKLQDFARECGVTDRAIQKHLKTYAEELEGLYERKGPNGTWLSDEACQILRSKMKQQPIVVGDAESGRKIEELQEENRKLLMALNGAKDRIIELQGAQARLEAAERETKLLEGFIQDAKEEIRTLTEEKAAAVAKAKQEAVEEKEIEFGTVRESFENELQELRKELERPLTFWERLTGRRKNN